MAEINGNKIYVLPCLQELKAQNKMIGRLVGYEYEQQPSKWDDNKPVPLFSGLLYGSADASSYFDQYWRGAMPDSNVTKNGLLEIPDCRDYGFESQCKKLDCSQKWKMYTGFLKTKCDSNKSNVALLVTHHNRMRDSIQGLIPFKSDSNFNAYANNFCLKIAIDTTNKTEPIKYSVFYPGFPDKGDFSGICISPEIQVGGGYEYSCATSENDASNFINTDLISEGIKDALENENNFKLDIYLIRHGNSLHNKPVNASDSFTPNQNRLDSSLTPLGMYQAYLLGEYFKNQGVFNPPSFFSSNTNIILCASFLQRTQLTGLLILQSALSTLPANMKNGLELMERQALIRYSRIAENFDASLFLNYLPLGTKQTPGKNIQMVDEFSYFLQTLKGKFLQPLNDEQIINCINKIIEALEPYKKTPYPKPTPDTYIPYVLGGKFIKKSTKKHKKYNRTKKRQNKKNKTKKNKKTRK